jgi:hypothetical protein
MIPTPIASGLASVVACLTLALPAAAQPAAPAPEEAAARDPLNARAPVPPVRYRSAFSGYRPLADDRLGWKEANDEVGRIGGWRAYAREANAPEPAASAPASAPSGSSPAAPKPPMPATDHGTHGGHGAHGSHDKKQ